MRMSLPDGSCPFDGRAIDLVAGTRRRVRLASQYDGFSRIATTATDRTDQADPPDRSDKRTVRWHGLMLRRAHGGRDVRDPRPAVARGAHLDAFVAPFAKVLVRYNPDEDPALNARQAAKLKALANWQHSRQRKLLLEMIVPATPAQLASVGGTSGSALQQPGGSDSPIAI
jgi:hypothetical protein